MEPRELYMVVLTCEACGRRTRASQMLRTWRDRPAVSHADAEAMITGSKGPGRIENARGPLWEQLARIRDARARHAFGTKLEEFFLGLERRLVAAGRDARDASWKARRL